MVLGALCTWIGRARRGTVVVVVRLRFGCVRVASSGTPKQTCAGLIPAVFPCVSMCAGLQVAVFPCVSICAYLNLEFVAPMHPSLI